MLIACQFNETKKLWKLFVKKHMRRVRTKTKFCYNISNFECLFSLFFQVLLCTCLNSFTTIFNTRLFSLKLINEA